jgi:hypothetical protein
MNIDEKKLDEELNDIVVAQKLVEAQKQAALLTNKEKLDNMKHNLEGVNYHGFMLASFGPPGVIDYDGVSADRIMDIAGKITEACGNTKRREGALAVCVVLASMIREMESAMGVRETNTIFNHATSEFMARVQHEAMIEMSKRVIEDLKHQSDDESPETE